jgi:tetratricopeptide (TPR) repeat protein
MNLKEYINTLVSLQKENRLKEALKLLYEALSIYPENNFLKKYEIFLLNKKGELYKAFALANNSFNRFKNDEFFIQTYLSILEKTKQKETLKEFLENFLSDAPQFSEKFFHYLQNIISRNFSSAEADILIEKFPINIEKKKNKTRGNYKIYKEKFDKMPPNEAINEIENLLMLPSYKEDFDLNMYLAGLYRKVKRFNDAVKIYNFLLTLKETTFLYKMLGYTYYRLNDHENALKYLKEVVFKDPNDNILMQTIFKIYEKNKDYNGFKQLIEKLLAQYPNVKKLYGYLKRAQKWQTN